MHSLIVHCVHTLIVRTFHSKDQDIQKFFLIIPPLQPPPVSGQPLHPTIVNQLIMDLTCHVIATEVGLLIVEGYTKHLENQWVLRELNYSVGATICKAVCC
jgi:hypothetical protein